MGPMMRLILGLVVLVLILGAVAFGLPSHVTVARSVVINAPEYAIFPYLNSPRRFSEWSPWSARDPNLKVTYSGPQEGKGAKIEWVSEQPSIGTGSMEIIESDPSKHIDLAVNYGGLEGTSSYALAPAGAGSKVTWSFGYETGTSPLKRWKALILDGFVGAEYSAGLERLKARVEKDRAPTMTPPPIVMPPQPVPPAAGGETVAPETVVPQAPQAQGAQQTAPAQAQPAAPQAAPPPPRRRNQQ
jgi:hypothetical protein